MIFMTSARSQETQGESTWVHRFPILAKLKGLANGVNPRWGTKTVIVSDDTGDIIRIESRRKKKAQT